MISTKKFIHGVLLQVLICMPLVMTAQLTSYHAGEDFSFTISGTSNMHDWMSEVTEFDADISVYVSESGDWHFESISVDIPVTAIKSEKGNIMDKKTYKALLADDYPVIRFVLKSPTPPVRSEVELQGNLTIAGKSKSVRVPVDVNKNGSGVMVSGSAALKMTDFGIDPPTALLGAMKTGDEITISFDIPITQ